MCRHSLRGCDQTVATQEVTTTVKHDRLKLQMYYSPKSTWMFHLLRQIFPAVRRWLFRSRRLPGNGVALQGSPHIIGVKAPRRQCSPDASLLRKEPEHIFFAILVQQSERHRRQRFEESHKRGIRLRRSTLRRCEATYLSQIFV